MRRPRPPVGAVRALLGLSTAAWLAACAPEVGSARWCEAMRDKPRGDWTANEALEFARSCVIERR
jgi:Protein of unknown function (DUF3012)